MLTPDHTDEALIHALNRHPHLKERITQILAIVEDDAGDLARAAAAERRVIEEVRRLGQDSLHAWAEQQVERTSLAAAERGDVRRAGKKNFAGTVRSD